MKKSRFNSAFVKRFTKEWNDICSELRKYNLEHVVIVKIDKSMK